MGFVVWSCTRLTVELSVHRPPVLSQNQLYAQEACVTCQTLVLRLSHTACAERNPRYLVSSISFSCVSGACAKICRCVWDSNWRALHSSIIHGFNFSGANRWIGDLKTNSNFWIDRFPYWQVPFIQTLDTDCLLPVQPQLIKLGN